VSGLAIITEACIDVKDRACVDVCPVQCIYEFDFEKNILFSEVSILYVNVDECTSCTACYQPDVCPVGAIYSEEHVPDGSAKARYNPDDPNKGHDHTFFIQHSRDVFGD
jgi:Fe-S-cluster-containing hydrogenase component 2